MRRTCLLPLVAMVVGGCCAPAIVNDGGAAVPAVPMKFLHSDEEDEHSVGADVYWEMVLTAEFLQEVGPTRLLAKLDTMSGNAGVTDTGLYDGDNFASDPYWRIYANGGMWSTPDGRGIVAGAEVKAAFQQIEKMILIGLEAGRWQERLGRDEQSTALATLYYDLYDPTVADGSHQLINEGGVLALVAISRENKSTNESKLDVAVLSLRNRAAVFVLSEEASDGIVAAYRENAAAAPK